MQFEIKKNNLVCLFPWLKDIDSIKCTGQICDTIASKYNVNAYILTYKNESYPKFQKYCPNTKLIFLKRKLKFGGWRITRDLLWFIIRNAKKIDILYLYHFADDYSSLPLVGYIYKKINKNGKLYVKFETDLETLSNTYPNIHKNGFKNFGKNLIKNTIVKKFFLSVDILGVGDNQNFDLSRKKYFWQLSGDRVRIQLNGYRFYEKTQLKEFKDKEDIILLAGRLYSHQKGLDVFLSALCLLNLTDWKVMLVGDINHEQINEIRNIEFDYPALAGKITILGFVNDITIYSKLINDSKVLCVPSHFDGLPLVIPDAMARGCVIVGSDIYGIKEIATNNGDCGFYFPKGDSVALANILNGIISKDYNLEEISKKSRKRAEEIFKWDKIVEGLQLENYLEKQCP